MTSLFIIFGTKYREKDYGECYPMDCPYCNNPVYYHALKGRRWFHLFWVPLIPFTADRVLICPICSTEVELSRAAFGTATELTTLIEEFDAGTRSSAEVEEHVAALTAELGLDAGQSGPERERSAPAPDEPT